MNSTIICVDDDKWTLTVLSDQLNEWFGANYAIEKALSGPEALELMDSCVSEGSEVALVISDYIMPGMKGDELLEQVKNKAPMTRRIMLTGFAAIEGITNAINRAGIYRFMAKPWDNKDMMLTILQALRSYEQDKRAEKLALSHKELYQSFQSMAVNLQTELNQIMGAIALAAASRSGDTPGHAIRVSDYCGRIAAALKMPESEIRNLRTSAMLHDIGKLLLTEQELEGYRGAGCFSRNDLAVKQAENAKKLLAHVNPAILPGIVYHMERLDGLGPYGIVSANIPIEARIIGLCNYLDVLCATHPGQTPADVLKGLAVEKGRMFDGLIYDTLLSQL